MLGRRKRTDPEDAASAAEMSRVLRSTALELDPLSVGLAPSTELPTVFGVVMDTTYPKGTATLVAIADGTTSLYMSTGGGFIGGGEHESVAEANRRLLLVAEAHASLFSPSLSTALPDVGQVQLSVLTYAGRRAVHGSEEDLGEERHLAAPIFHAAHAVIAELRMKTEGSAGGPPPPAPPGGATPLMAAAYTGDVAAVTHMSGRGDELEARDDDGYTALMFAANAGQDAVVTVLLEHGADYDAADGQGSTPLMFAAQHGHLGVVRQLLAAGVAINARGDHGLTALEFARQNGHQSVVAVLISGGAA